MYQHAARHPSSLDGLLVGDEVFASILNISAASKWALPSRAPSI